MVVYLAVEGDSDVPVAERMIRSVGLEPYRAVVARGKSQLDPRIPDLNRSGTRLNWLILRDLDHDAPCASALIEHLVPHARLSPRVSLRIPVRAMESWILADADGFARAFSVKRGAPAREPGRLGRSEVVSCQCVQGFATPCDSERHGAADGEWPACRSGVCRPDLRLRSPIVGSRPGGSAFSKSQPNALNAPRTGRQRDLVLIGPARLRAPCRRSPTGIYSGKRAMLVISKRRVEHTIDRMSTMCKSARHS